MNRLGLSALILLLALGCSDWKRVPPPPVRLSVLESSRSAAAGSGGGSARVSNGPRVRLVRALAPGSLATIHIPDIAGTSQRFRGTSLYKLFTSPQMVAMFGKAGVDVSLFSATGMPAGVGPGGMDLRKLQRALSGEVVLSLEDIDLAAGGPIPQVRALAAITIDGAEPEMRQLIDFVSMMAAQDKDTMVEQGSVAGVPYTRFRSKKNGMSVEIEVALYRNALVVGMGKEIVTEAIERLADESVEALPDDASFGRSMQRISHSHDAVRVHVDVSSILARFGKMLPSEARMVFDLLGVEHILSLSSALRIDGQDLVTSTFIDSPGGKDFLTSLLARHPIDLGILDRVPASTTSFSLFTLDGAAVLEQLRAKLPAKEKEELEQGLAALRKDGLDIEKDLFPVFGPRCALVTIKTNSRQSAGIDQFWNHLMGSALLIETHDRDKVNAQLARLPDSSDEFVKFEDRIGATHVIGYRFQGPQLPSNFAVYIASVGDHLIVALSHEAMRHMLQRPKREATLHFRKEIESVPDNAVAIGYDDMSAGSGMLMQAFMSGITQAQAATNASEVASDDDWAKLPMGDFNPSLSYTIANEHGLLSVTRSPTGGLTEVGGLTGLVVAASVAIPSLAKARVATNETAALATLRAIQSAQSEFRVGLLRDGDGDGEGENAFLSELIGDAHGRVEGATPTGMLPGFRRTALGYEKSGYIFRIYLPAEDGSPIGDHESRVRLQEVDGDLAETIGVIVAWPRTAGVTGLRSFFVDPQGVRRFCSDGYGGENGPSPDLFTTQRGNLAAAPIGRRDRTHDGKLWFEIR